MSFWGVLQEHCVCVPPNPHKPLNRQCLYLSTWLTKAHLPLIRSIEHMHMQTHWNCSTSATVSASITRWPWKHCRSREDVEFTSNNTDWPKKLIGLHRNRCRGEKLNVSWDQSALWWHNHPPNELKKYRFFYLFYRCISIN